MPRKSQTSKKGKTADASSSNPATHEEGTETTTFPWPRPDNTPFLPPQWYVDEIPHTTLKEVIKKPKHRTYKHGDPWSHLQCQLYNGLLRLEIAPTRFVCEHTLKKMGIEKDVRHMLQRMGLGAIAYRTFPLYPELVRQFLASAELRYKDGAIPTASEGTLSYFSSGTLYEITLMEICEIYGFDTTAELCRFPSDFPESEELWSYIANGRYESRSAKLTHIRNPVVRVVAKIIGNIFFAKEESGAVKRDELMLLHFGLPIFAHSLYSVPPPSRLRTNLGAIFAENLVSKKARGLNTVNAKTERIGSLITPIFMYHGIDLGSTPSETRIDYFDEKYFKNSSILKPNFIYQFRDREGFLQTCKLPLPDHTALTSRENLEFIIPPELLRQNRFASRHRGVSPRASTSQPHLEDDIEPDRFPQSAQPADDMEYALPTYTGEYDLPPLAADATDAERWTWLIESQRRSHSMMQRMWGALARMRCPRPPTCFRGTETREDRETTAPDAHASDAHDPDVAGHRISDDEDTDELSDPGSRLKRSRRRPGQSHSDSPEDH